MGLFGFNTKQETNTNWIKLIDIDALEGIINKSYEKPQLIFKHSTRCSISSMALNRFESSLGLIADKADTYYLDLIAFREISNEIASKFNITHQSPQVILIKNGESTYDASHSSIRGEDVLKKL